MMVEAGEGMRNVFKCHDWKCFIEFASVKRTLNVFKKIWIARSRLLTRKFASEFIDVPPLKTVKLRLILASTGPDIITAEQKLFSLHNVHVTLFHSRIDDEESIHVVAPPDEKEN